MKKRIISLMLSIILCFSVLSAGSLMTAYASSFEQELANQGFTDVYIAKLTELHNKYPNWKFEALQTGLSLSQAVANERTPHSQQVIQMTRSNASRNFYCKCSSCYKNGNYVIQEGSSWVSASESAVEYYLNPINFLDETYIYQFESTAYNSAQTEAGVETIIKNTWMYNSYIEYYDTNGNYVTYSPKTKYSQAIMKAAKDSGLSAYYLASKIVQEVGGAKPTAGGASGKNSSYPGIYNYYNIGANTGATDGLKWASASVSGFSTNTTNVRLRSEPNTSSKILATLPKGTNATYISSTAKQADGYVWYNVKVTYNGSTLTGYIRSDLIGDSYNRPWTNPYLSIYNGAKWIAKNFTSTQCNGYLQKFNVNPASSNRYEHEYMANVQAAASEAGITYKAYKNANLVSAPKTFIIPIYSGLGEAQIGNIDNVTITNISGFSATVNWNTATSATGYVVETLSSPTGNWEKAVTTSSRSYTLTNLQLAHNYSVRITPFRKTSTGVISYGSTSHSFGFTTLNRENALKNMSSVGALRLANITDTSFDVSFNAINDANAYFIQYSVDNKTWNTAASTTKTNVTISNLKKDTYYYVRVVSGVKDGDEYYSSDKYSNIYKCLTKANNVSLSDLKYTDLNGYDYYADYVAYTSVYNTYINGTNPPEFTKFSPKTSLTRAMIVTILYNMAGRPYDNGNNPHKTNPFTDANENAYYYLPACWALDNGITNQTTFLPNKDVPREQTVSFLFRYATHIGAVTDEDYKNVSLSTYGDYETVSEWATESMQWAVYEGIINGTAQGNIDPSNITQRIHASKILYVFGKSCNIGNFE